jgi:endonuclease/exonuclease/phosphatase family metal-dependent hydrolase
MLNRFPFIFYNIHRCIGGDRKISPERISDVISLHQPVVVALQEVDCGQVRPAMYDQAGISIPSPPRQSSGCWKEGSGMSKRRK